ncbi:alpha/beta hydrolase [uncultured Erythrobacter sp.]|uniref:alpha/beta fold hydrolase n=1 Tax=uncultured Erythrobacter sp. TaxID=263913 RepID=UPI002613C1E1|nr:alpha/beta hydrolase [uncultured Erythrobacter sp.]
MKWLIRIVLTLAAVLVIAFLVFRTPDTDASEMRAKYGDEPSQFVKLATGLTVHLRDEGPRDAPAIILLHGANSSLHTWDEWTQSLSEEYRVIRYDQVGHGLTGPAPDGDYSKERFVADVDAIANHFGLARFVLAGNSMGGWVSTAYAIEHSDRVTGLALLNASGAPRNKEEERLYLGAKIAQTPVLNSLMTTVTPRSLVRSSLEDAVADPASISDVEVERYWELLRYPGNRQAVVDRANTARGGPFDPVDIAALPMPALIIWGEEDRVTPVSGAEWYAEHLANDTTVIYPDVAHLPMEEAADASVADFKSWLANLELTNQDTQSEQ